MRTPVPISVDGLGGLKREQVLPGQISLSEHGLFTELVVDHLLRRVSYAAIVEAP